MTVSLLSFKLYLKGAIVVVRHGLQTGREIPRLDVWRLVLAVFPRPETCR